MAGRLWQTLAFTNVAAGATATLSHSLNVQGTAVKPDRVEPDNAWFTIVSVTTTQVTVRNNGGAAASCNVLLERIHSVARELGGNGVLSPAPFIPAYGAPTSIFDPGFVTVVGPGANKGAEINAAIAAAAAAATSEAKKTVQLMWGDYTLETPIVGASNVILQGIGPQTRLIPTYTGDADTNTNAAILARGTLNAARLNTSLSADVAMNTTSCTVVAAGSIAADDWILVYGNNDGGQNYVGDFGFSDGSEVILREPIQLTSVVGTTLTTKTPFMQNHAGNVKASVQALTPIIGFEVRDLAILGSQSGVTTACGIFAQYVIGLEIHNVSVGGTSRGAIEMQAVKGFKSSGFYSYGTNNAWYFVQTCFNGDVWGWNGKAGVPRSHPQGVPRQQIYARFRCTNVSFHDGICVNGTWGVFHCGGVNMSFANIHVDDMEMTEEAYSRWVNSEDGGGFTGSFLALGYGSGLGPLNICEFAYGTQWLNMSVQNVRVPSTAAWTAAPYRGVAIYIHDTMRIEAANLSVINVGTAVPIAAGRFSDCEGTLTGYTVKGYNYGFWSQNVGTDLRIVNYRYDPNYCAGVTGIAMYLDHSSVAFNGPVFENVQINSSFGGILRTGGAFQFDQRFRIRNLETDDGVWEYVKLALNNTGVAFAAGDIVQIDTANTNADLRIVTPTAAGDYLSQLLACCNGAGSDPGTGFLLVAPLPQVRATVKATTAAVAYGDRMVYAATRRAAASAGATQFIGTAYTRKAAGAEGMIILGPAN